MNKHDEGFTLLETLTAIAVISIAGLALLSGVSIATRALEKAKTRAMYAARLLSADERLRELIGQVAIPYWERNAGLVVRNEAAYAAALELPWYQGQKDAVLRIAFVKRDAQTMLEINTPDKRDVIMLDFVGELTLGLILDADKQPRGVDIQLADYHSRIAFASRPFSEAFHAY
jgi:prepilin-type N-terminal cleavage/methylation domain-containing protein